jgi:hypothetical protein
VWVHDTCYTPWMQSLREEARQALSAVMELYAHGQSRRASSGPLSEAGPDGEHGSTSEQADGDNHAPRDRDRVWTGCEAGPPHPGISPNLWLCRGGALSLRMEPYRH